MKRDIEKRLDALERRKAHRKYADTLAAFYALPDAEKARRVAPFYGEQPNGKS